VHAKCKIIRNVKRVEYEGHIIYTSGVNPSGNQRKTTSLIFSREEFQLIAFDKCIINTARLACFSYTKMATVDHPAIN
jgi:hypothetical protein